MKFMDDIIPNFQIKRDKHKKRERGLDALK